MANKFERFMDIDIPMLEKYKNEKDTPDSEKEAFIERYRQLMEKGNPIQFVVGTVGADGTLRQNLRGVDIVMPPDQLYEDKVITVAEARSAIGRHFVAAVTDIKDGVIYVSRVKAVIGDGSVRDRANRRIRTLINEMQRLITPHLEALRAQAEKEGKEYEESFRAKGQSLRDGQLQTFIKNRYDELVEKKKDELGVQRCIVPAVVESVRGKRVILNIFNLEIVGVCRQDNWSRKPKTVRLEEQTHPGDEVEVEVLYHIDPKLIKDPTLNSGWVVSRRNIMDRNDVGSFQNKVKDCPVGSTVQVVCENFLTNTAGLNGYTRWYGHIKETDIRVFVRYGNRRVGVSKGGIYAVEIQNVNEARLQLEGKALGFVYNDGEGGAYIPKRVRNNDRLPEVTADDEAYDSPREKERPVTDGFE